MALSKYNEMTETIFLDSLQKTINVLKRENGVTATKEEVLQVLRNTDLEKYRNVDVKNIKGATEFRNLLISATFGTIISKAYEARIEEAAKIVGALEQLKIPRQE